MEENKEDIKWTNTFEQMMGSDVWKSNTGIIAMFSVDDGMEHISMSHKSRLPTYWEMKTARYVIMSKDITVAQLFPPESEFVNLHNYCLHLWEISAEHLKSKNNTITDADDTVQELIVSYDAEVGIVDNISKTVIFPFIKANMIDEDEQIINGLLLNISKSGIKFMLIDDSIVATSNIIENKKFNHAKSYGSYAELIANHPSFSQLS